MKKKVTNKKEPAKVKPVQKKKEASLFVFLAITFFVLVPLIFFVMAPCLKNGFSNWDDPTYLENNPLITRFNFENIKKIFTQIYFSNYQPLHIFSYLIEYQFFKLNPFGYHLVSIVMHAGVTILVVWFTILLTANRIIAFIAGLLFAVHPLHVESIAWAAERKDLLYAFFFFASLIAYLGYLKNTASKKLYLLCFLMFVLSVFSKAMAASLPPVLFLFDFYYKRKFNFALIAEKIPFFILAIVMGLISVYASSRDGSINTNTDFNFFERIILASHNLLQYFFKLVVPYRLSSYYPYPDKINGSLPWYYFITPLAVIALIVFTFYSLKLNRIIFLCIGFFMMTVFLVLQILPVGPTVFSERYSYIPSASFFILVGFLIIQIIEKNKENNVIRYGLYGSLAIYTIWLCIVTYDRCKIWKDPDTFWSDVISKFDNVPIAYNNRGHYYNKTGKKQEALADFNKAVSLNANYDMARFNRGSLYGEMGKMNEALEDLNIAISLNKKLPEAYKMRGQVYAMVGKPEMALSDFNKALELQPDFPEIFFNLGVFYFNAGNKTEACKNFTKANQLHFEKAKDALEKFCK